MCGLAVALGLEARLVGKRGHKHVTYIHPIKLVRSSTGR